MAGEKDTFEVYQDKKGEYRWGGVSEVVEI